MSVTGLGVAAAVAQRRRTEEALARSAAIVESSDDAIIGKTLDGTIEAWNRGAQRLYGYTAEQAVGRNVSMLATPEQPDEMAGILERLRRGETIDSYETRRSTRDGRVVVLDFGLISDVRSEPLAADLAAGTPPYLAPEQHRGEAPSEATELVRDD